MVGSYTSQGDCRTADAPVWKWSNWASNGNRLVDTKPRSIFASTGTHKSPKVSLHAVPAECLDSIYKPLKSLG
jgi:hypothetical protein